MDFVSPMFYFSASGAAAASCADATRLPMSELNMINFLFMTTHCFQVNPKEYFLICLYGRCLLCRPTITAQQRKGQI